MLQVDHTKIEYQSFDKNFYVEHDNIAGLDVAAVGELRRKLGITVRRTV